MPRTSLILGLIAVGAALAVGLTVNWGTLTNAANPQEKSQVDISIIDGGSEVCNSATDTKCTLEVGQDFTVAIVPTAIPLNGYGGWQTRLDFGDLQYNQAAELSEEMKFDGLLPVRSPNPPDELQGFVLHGNTTGLLPPLPKSNSKDAWVNLSFTCNEDGTLALAPYNGGTNPDGVTFVDPDGTTVYEPNVGSIDVNCAEPPTEGPTATPTEVTPSPTPEPVTPSPTPEKECGDVNDDGDVNSLDALFVLWDVAELATPPNPGSADVDGSGAIDAIDAALILQFEAELINMLTC